jgi:hypothetical protein
VSATVTTAQLRRYDSWIGGLGVVTAQLRRYGNHAG